MVAQNSLADSITVLKPQNQSRTSSWASAVSLVLLKQAINDFSFASVFFFFFFLVWFSEKYAQVQQNPILPPASLFLWCKNSEEVSTPSFFVFFDMRRIFELKSIFSFFKTVSIPLSFHPISQGPPLSQWHAAGEEGDGARLRENHQLGQRVPDHQLIGQRQAWRAREGGGHGHAGGGKDWVDVSGPGKGTVSHSMLPAHSESLC